MRNFILCLLLLCAVIVDLQAKEDFAGESAFTYLKVARGARIAAVGECGASLRDDANVLYYNPAVLAFMKYPQLSFQNLSYVESINLTHAVFAQALENFSYGIGLGYLNAGSFDRYDPQYTKIGSFTAGDYDSVLSGGFKLSDIASVGLNLKYTCEKLDTKKKSAFLGDAGLFVTDYDDKVGFGFCVQNLGASVKYNEESFSLPRIIRGGLSVNQYEKYTALFEALNSSDSGLEFHFGLEVVLGEVVDFRAGYKYINDNKPKLNGGYGLSGGLGFNFGRVGVDYAIAPYDDFGLTHRVSLNYNFSKIKILE